MKIAFFNSTFKKEDGVTVVILNLIKEAVSRGFKCVFITGFAEDASISPVPVWVIPSFTFPLYRDYHVALPGEWGFEKKLDEFKPDVLHVHSPDTIAWAAAKYARERKIPAIVTHHTNFTHYLSYYHIEFLSRVAWALLRQTYKHFDLITTPSSVTAEDLISHKVTNVRSIPWGVDFKRFDSSFRSEEWRKKMLLGGKKHILLCVCRMTWEKDLKTLAEAYNILKKQRNDFAMVVAGDGPNKKDLEELMPGAIFLGHVEGKDLSAAYASSDIFLFPSSTETFGNVTIEAMASGIVPVVANAGGSKSLVSDGKNGFLCEPKNANDFAKKTSTLLDNPKLRGKVRENCLKFSKDFSWERVFDKFVKIYEEFKR